MSFGGSKKILVGGHAILDELSDEKRFHKGIGAIVSKVRHLTGDGLFTAPHDAPAWGVAHRILMPVFGPMKIREMFPEMKDLAQQLLLKWARYGDEEEIPITEDFTRLTLDTIALCSMDFRFNSFYKDEMHPFVESMNKVLKEAGTQAQFPEIINYTLRRFAVDKFNAEIAIMREIGASIIQKRRTHPVDSPDLLNTLIHGRDPQTGEGLSDELIIDELITFLVAGHETTSGLLSFAFYYLLANPSALAAARTEIDTVIGTAAITVEHLAQLPYLNAVLRETLRLQPTAPIYELIPFEDTVIGDKYSVKKGDSLLVILPAVHRDPAVWGTDADVFRPERMLDGDFEKLPKNAWKPFGNGSRACIGRAFAWQEALLVTALLLQNFDCKMADPGYLLKVKDTLTIKPDDFRMKVKLRRGRSATQLLTALGSVEGIERSTAAEGDNEEDGAAERKPMTILYGSNSGSCETLAHRLARDAEKKGWAARQIATLDAAVNKLPKGQPVIVVTASYDGQPADNAAKFVNWLEALDGKPLEGVTYAVFGCGHRDWQSTLYKVPTLINGLLEKAGARRIASMGTADSAVSNLLSDLDAWQEEKLWPALGHEADDSGEANLINSLLQVEISKPRRNKIYSNLVEATVTEARLLTAPGASKKKHVEVKLPPGIEYAPGDHMQVLPVNTRRDIQRALARFQLTWDALIKVSNKKSGIFPAGESIAAGELLGNYVELTQPATPKDIRILAAAAANPATKAALADLATLFSDASIGSARTSVLDLLTTHFPSAADIPLQFGTFLFLLPPLRLRTYSISSALAHHPGHASLTFSVVGSQETAAASPSTGPQGAGLPHLGVASNYLAELSAGDIVYVAHRPTKAWFGLPERLTTPIVMVAVGSGVAPFRGFVQERAFAIRTNNGTEEVAAAPALLFFGCRSPGVDDLYREEWDRFEEEGVVSVRRAYSRVEEGRELGRGEWQGYVQDVLRQEGQKEELTALWENGAKIYVCGSPKMAKAVKEVFANIAWDAARKNGDQEAAGMAAGEWFRRFENERCAVEIFA
ncbi:Flavodoxin [Macrophomina phaseolina MS6]|uniref:Bifunctional cytochrome P450/NADPH--P450 reductase n=1 Tax=Macrophomina phaseolina (strain MS6) TaxID=1126212 RepID=K2SC10_MACPH|nr:Flavodoxin [Macrophomina phaseolina MS6]